MKGPLFYAKILLFGEYGIIKDSKGLSIPYNAAMGALIIPKNSEEGNPSSNSSLAGFAVHLADLQSKNPELFSFDLKQLKADISNGLYFDSTIPQGYGIGSSGALVAAIYDNYAQHKITVLENLTREKLLQLKQLFFMGKVPDWIH